MSSWVNFLIVPNIFKVKCSCLFFSFLYLKVCCSTASKWWTCFYVGTGGLKLRQTYLYCDTLHKHWVIGPALWTSWPMCARGHPLYLFVQNDLSLFYKESVLMCICPSAVKVKFTYFSCHWSAGLIWSRYSLVIIPKNWNLFCVNFFLGCAGGSQLYRIWRFVL